MNIRFSKRILLVPASTISGVLFGGLVWLVLYATTSTKAFKLDGPAVGWLGLSMLIGGLITGIAAIVYWAHKEKRSLKGLICMIVILLLTACVACILIGLPIARYAQDHYSYSICDVSDFCK